MVSKFADVQQVENVYLQLQQELIGQCGRELTRALQHVMDLRLGDAHHSRQSAFAELTVANPGIDRTNKSRLESSEGDFSTRAV